jgi:hypothetical protein
MAEAAGHEINDEIQVDETLKRAQSGGREGRKYR